MLKIDHLNNTHAKPPRKARISSMPSQIVERHNNHIALLERSLMFVEDQV